VLLKRNANNSTVKQADAYVRGEAAATGRSWLVFCAALESGVAPADVGTLLAAAEQTFSACPDLLCPDLLTAQHKRGCAFFAETFHQPKYRCN